MQSCMSATPSLSVPLHLLDVVEDARLDLVRDQVASPACYSHDGVVERARPENVNVLGAGASAPSEGSMTLTCWRRPAGPGRPGYAGILPRSQRPFFPFRSCGALGLTLGDDLDAGGVPRGLALPSADAHPAEGNDGDGSVAIAKLDARANLACQPGNPVWQEREGGGGAYFWDRALDGHFGIDPVPPREGEVERRPVRRRVLTPALRIWQVALQA